MALAVAGLTLFGLAAFDWQDYRWALVHHAKDR